MYDISPTGHGAFIESSTMEYKILGDIMDKLSLAFEFRHACKRFDQSKKISHAEIEVILDAGRLSPSSFGLEPWHFVVVDNTDIKAQLRAACYDQDKASQDFLNYITHGLGEGLNTNNWSEMQGYIAAANMMTTAAYHNIDSCALGGFQYDKVINILEKHIPTFSHEVFGVGLCLAFGYRIDEQPPHIRWSLQDVTTYLS